LFHNANRIDRSVTTSGLLNTRASSMTSAIPEPPLGIRASVALELRFDPINRHPVARSTLPPISELGQPFDRSFVRLEIEPSDQNPDRVGRSVLRLGAGRLTDDRGNNSQVTGPNSIHRFLSSAGFA
jgi:hypothetical protein